MKKYLFGIALIIVGYTQAQWQSSHTSVIDSMLQMYVDARQLSGVILVAKDNQVLYQKAFGMADREKQIPNDISTNFNIASMGKTFTATLIMQLIQEGKLSLHSTLESILPNSGVQKADSITVYHLLTHSSGVGNYMVHKNYEQDRTKLTSLASLMPYVKEMEPTMPFVGAAHHYSNSGFILLGRIIETITGKPYTQNLQERIFKKAGIQHSYIHYPATFEAPKEAVPYMAYTAKTYHNAVAEEFPAYSDGGMQSNVGDLWRFGKSLLNKQLLGQAFSDSMWKGRMDIGRGGQYAFGWIDNTNPWGKKVVSHDGGGKGFSTDLKLVVEDGYVVVVLLNNRVNPREVSNNILSIIYTGKYQQPEKYLETVLTEVMEEKGFSYMLANYAAILKTEGLDKTPSPWVIIRFSDMLENLGEFEKAFAIQELGRKEFPKETSMYNITGQLFATQGKKAEAKQWFDKALAIDPKDEFARMMLKQLGL
jgi:CubicO group peptidase (beta-lactamase class C family)